MGKSYYNKKKSNSWTNVFQDGVKNILRGVGKKIGNEKFLVVNACNPAARVCVYVLIGLTLLFSGLGLYSWLILIMLIIILQFV